MIILTIIFLVVLIHTVPSGFSIVISDGGATPTAGESYSLTCNVSGGSVDTYHWRKDGVLRVSGETAAMLSFFPLWLSDAGRYTCEASATSFTVVRRNQSVIIQSEFTHYTAQWKTLASSLQKHWQVQTRRNYSLALYIASKIDICICA